MRKMTVVLDISLAKRFGLKDVFRDIERLEGRQLIRFDPNAGVKVALVDLILRPGRTLADVDLPGSIRIADVLRSEGQRHTCILRIEADERTKALVHLFDLDLIFVPPLIADEEKVVASFMSDDERLRKIVSAMRLVGIVRDVHVSEFALPDEGALSVLTDRQREVITAAKRLGYYEVPRRASTKDVAKELGISKATAVEHIRKAEQRLIEHVLAGA